MKTILVTTDLSSESALAFKPAIEMATAYGAKIALLAIAEELPPTTISNIAEMPLMIDPKIQKEISERVKEGLEKLKNNHFAGTTCETIFRESFSPPHRVILEVADKIKADSIVMASHGRTGVGHVIFGSVTERVLRDAKCPVLVVPTKYSSK